MCKLDDDIVVLILVRHQMEGEYDQPVNLSGHGLMPMAEVNRSTNLWKQVMLDNYMVGRFCEN